MTLLLGRLGVLVLLAGCMDGAQLANPAPPPPAPVPATTPTTPIAPPPAFPPLSRPGQIYRAPDSLYDAYVNTHGSSLASRYVLYDGGEFGLQFASVRFPFFEYPGRYFVADSVFTFDFADDGRWHATGVLRGNSLAVTYNDAMMMSDFIDGVYVRSP